MGLGSIKLGSLRLAVVLRQVPDPEAPLEIDPATASVVEGAVPWVVDEADEAALDAALQLAAAGGGEVLAIALGPERAEQAARKALALGATRALRIVEAGSSADVRVDAALVAAVVRRESIDLLLAGAQSGASGSGLLASACGAALGWPWIWLVLAAELEDGAPPADGGARDDDPDRGEPGPRGARRARTALRVVQELEGGRRRRWRIETPAVLAIQTGRYRGRMPTIRGVLAAKRHAIELVEAAMLGVTPDAPVRALRRVGLDRPAPAGGVEWIRGSGGPDGEGPSGEGASGVGGDGGADADAARRTAERLVRRLREVGAL